MTHRDLPVKPDIQNLRKEAKGLYRRLKRQAPEANLADAQFILAAEYGFKSWGKLKSQIDRGAKKRWAARLAEQEGFTPIALSRSQGPQPSFQPAWLGRRERLTEDDADGLATPAQTAWLHIGALLLALVIAMIMASR